MSEIKKALEKVVTVLKETITAINEHEEKEIDADKISEAISDNGYTFRDLNIDLDDFGIDPEDAAPLTNYSEMISYHGTSECWDALADAESRHDFAEMAVRRTHFSSLMEAVVEEEGLAGLLAFLVGKYGAEEVIGRAIDAVPEGERENYGRVDTDRIKAEIKAQITDNLFKGV